MTEPVKRYVSCAVYRYGKARGEMLPDPTGEWCRYEPRFDAPQLSREEVDLIEWAWLHAAGLLGTQASAPKPAAKLHEIRELITRLRAEPQASPWVPCSNRMPTEPIEWLQEGEKVVVVWVTDGETVVQGCLIAESNKWLDANGNPLFFIPTHWAPIIRPEPPGVG